MFQNVCNDAALHLAIARHRHEAVEVLLGVEGIDLTLPNGSGFPMVPHACSLGNAQYGN